MSIMCIRYQSDISNKRCNVGHTVIVICVFWYFTLAQCELCVPFVQTIFQKVVFSKTYAIVLMSLTMFSTPAGGVNCCFYVDGINTTGAGQL